MNSINAVVFNKYGEYNVIDNDSNHPSYFLEDGLLYSFKDLEKSNETTFYKEKALDPDDEFNRSIDKMIDIASETNVLPKSIVTNLKQIKDILSKSYEKDKNAPLTSDEIKQIYNKMFDILNIYYSSVGEIRNWGNNLVTVKLPAFTKDWEEATIDVILDMFKNDKNALKNLDIQISQVYFDENNKIAGKIKNEIKGKFSPITLISEMLNMFNMIKYK